MQKKNETKTEQKIVNWHETKSKLEKKNSEHAYTPCR